MQKKKRVLLRFFLFKQKHVSSLLQCCSCGSFCIFREAVLKCSASCYPGVAVKVMSKARSSKVTRVYYNNIKPQLKELSPVFTLSELKSHLSWPFLSRSHIQTRHHTRLCFFPPTWNDCCYIYSWPAINASSGKMVITNGSRNTKSPLWSWRHWQEVYLVDRIDQHI